MWRVSSLFAILLVNRFAIDAAPQAGGAGGGVAGNAGDAAVDRPMIAPVPPPPPGFGGPCIEEGATGFINDTCKTDADCYDSSSMTCTKGRCACVANYVQDPAQPKSTKRTCVPIPSLFSPCSSVCQRPYECKAGMGPGMEMMGMPVMNSDGKTCQCPGKSRYVNGYCDAGCKSDQRVGDGGKCVPRCTKDQILIESDCKKLANLGESCSDSAQCTAAFTTCQSGKCACADGFSAQGGKCVPKTYTCPFGDPLKKGDSVVLCQGSSNYPMPVCMGGMCPMAAAAGRGGPPPPSPPVPEKAMAANSVASSMPISARPYKTDSCPTSHYCYNYDFTGPNARGHCCPKSAAKCPVGDAHPTAQCNGVGQACPYQTHTCLSVGGPGDYTSPLCCPKPCQGYDKVLVKDQCLPNVQYGDGCQANEQCQGHNGVCQGGKCTCGAKAKPIDIGGPNKYCQLSCNSDEIAMGTECKKRLKLGDSCSNADGTSILCPSGAYCNNKGVCTCPCGSVKMNDRFCAPPPYCPSSPFAGAPAMQNDPKKFTFCKQDSDSKTPVTAVDTCPKNTFCSGYVENMGVCCPQPEPYCPDGSKPTSKRNCHNNEQTCAPTEMCNVYFSSVTNKPNAVPQQGSVCCPMMQPIPVPMQPMPMDAAASNGGKRVA